MLRRILISLGLLIAFLPYLGFPHSWQSVISTTSGFLIVGALLMSRRRRKVRSSEGESAHDDEGKSLHVERMEIVERPEVHVERETVIDTERHHEGDDTETTVEKKVTVLRRRNKKVDTVPSDQAPNGSIETPPSLT